MLRKLGIFTLLSLFILPSTLQSQTPQEGESAPPKEFREFTTYDVVRGPDQISGGLLWGQEAYDGFDIAIDSELQYRNYRRSSHPNMKIYIYFRMGGLKYHEKTKHYTNFYYNNEDFIGAYDGYDVSLHNSSYNRTVENMAIGTLIFDVVDVAQKKLVWTNAVQSLYEGGDQDVQGKINRSTKMVLANYPFFAPME